MVTSSEIQELTSRIEEELMNTKSEKIIQNFEKNNFDKLIELEKTNENKKEVKEKKKIEPIKEDYIKKDLKNIKNFMILIILFYLISLENVDNIIKKGTIYFTDNDLCINFCKSLIFALLFFILKLF